MEKKRTQSRVRSLYHVLLHEQNGLHSKNIHNLYLTSIYSGRDAVIGKTGNVKAIRLSARRVHM